VTENTIVSRDVTNHTLYAKWTANTYTVSFDVRVDGGFLCQTI
jgi:hypothetical protein